MRAARYYGKEDIRIEDNVPAAPVRAGQVKIAPAFVGICGTDLHEFVAGPTFAPTTPHPVTKETIPITVGHEFSGTITQLGAESPSHLKVGQKVAVKPNIYCGVCGACRTGVENACHNGGFVGLSGGGGGMSEEVVMPADAIFPLPDNVDLDIAALVEPLSVAWHAVDSSPLAQTPDAQVLVLGGGPIGLAVVQVLLARGAGRVIMSEVAAKRQQFARQFGAHHVLDPSTYDLVATSRALCGGENGPDIVFDCAGVPVSLETACKAVKSRGTVMNVAIWEKPVPFDPNWLVFKEAKYQAVLGYNREDFQGVIDALGNGSLKPEKMITSRIALDNLVEHGIWALIKEKDKHVKILVDMNATPKVSA
ncbi:hypothetical protein MBLNU230_g4606t1 [Neophaeotheca triangularis]